MGLFLEEIDDDNYRMKFLLDYKGKKDKIKIDFITAEVFYNGELMDKNTTDPLFGAAIDYTFNQGFLDNLESIKEEYDENDISSEPPVFLKRKNSDVVMDKENVDLVVINKKRKPAEELYPTPPTTPLYLGGARGSSRDAKQRAKFFEKIRSLAEKFGIQLYKSKTAEYYNEVFEQYNKQTGKTKEEFNKEFENETQSDVLNNIMNEFLEKKNREIFEKKPAGKSQRKKTEVGRKLPKKGKGIEVLNDEQIKNDIEKPANVEVIKLNEQLKKEQEEGELEEKKELKEKIKELEKEKKELEKKGSGWKPYIVGGVVVGVVGLVIIGFAIHFGYARAFLDYIQPEKVIECGKDILEQMNKNKLEEEGSKALGALWARTVV